MFISTAFIYGVVPETRNKEPETIVSEIPSFGSCLSYTVLASEINSSDDVSRTELEGPGGSTEKWL